MLEALELLKVEIKRIRVIAKVFRAKVARSSLKAAGLSDLRARAEYREEEARRFQIIADILEREYEENEYL